MPTESSDDDIGPSPRLVIEPLDPAKHQRAGFSCGVARLDNFLHRTARKQQAADFTRVRVLIEGGESPVLGYHALNAHALETLDSPPPEMARHAPRSGSIPAVYLSMIAVDQRQRGRGMGRILLADALGQAVAAAERIGIKAVVLDVIEDGGPEVAERRRGFHLAMGFQPFPSRPTRLFIGIDTVRAAREQVFGQAPSGAASQRRSSENTARIDRDSRFNHHYAGWPESINGPSPVTTIDTLIPVPVRQLWPNEANDFTPWLHDNPSILGDLLGTELFAEDREASVGRYSADLLFRDNSDRVVVVENMFGPTDHDHLGKLITYSAGLDAGVAVLVAEEFRDEHRSALDWLNHVSHNDFAFFGIILEAWRIGDSNPAPRLRVDTQPDGWSRAVRAPTSGESPTAQAYRRFWHLFLPRLHEAEEARPNWSRVSTPSKRNWMSFGSARSELLRYNPLFCHEPRRGCRIEAYLDSTLVDPSQVFDWLNERRGDIDSAVNQPLEWTVLTKARRVASPSTSPMKSESRTNTAGPSSLIGWCRRYAPSKTRSTRLSKTTLQTT